MAGHYDEVEGGLALRWVEVLLKMSLIQVGMRKSLLNSACVVWEEERCIPTEKKVGVD